ncbi:MAG: hypothetical protein ABI850_11580 [Flavobacterium sp.]
MKNKKGSSVKIKIDLIYRTPVIVKVLIKLRKNFTINDEIKALTVFEIKNNPLGAILFLKCNVYNLEHR